MSDVSKGRNGPTRLRGMVVDRVDLVGMGANFDKSTGEGAHVRLFKSAAEDVEKKDYSADERKKMAESGEAMSDGSFPIADKGDLKNAIRLAGNASDPAAARRHIIKRAKALGASDMIPDSWVNKGFFARVSQLFRTDEDISKHDQMDTAGTYDDAMAEYQHMEAYDAVMQEFWQSVYALQESVSSVLCDDTPGLNRQGVLKTSIDQFSSAFESSTGDWLRMIDAAASGTDVYVGKKFAAEAREHLSKAAASITTLTEKSASGTIGSSTPERTGSAEGEGITMTVPINKSALPEDVRKYIEELESSVAKSTATSEEEDVFKGMSPTARSMFEDMQKRQKDSDERVAKMQDEAETKEYFGKAAAFKAVPGVTQEALAKALRSIAKSAPDAYATVETALTAANAAIDGALTGDVPMAGIGANGQEMGAEGSALSELNKKAEEIRKSDSKLSPAQAFVEAGNQNPALLKKYRGELEPV